MISNEVRKKERLCFGQGRRIARHLLFSFIEWDKKNLMAIFAFGSWQRSIRKRILKYLFWTDKKVFSVSNKIGPKANNLIDNVTDFSLLIRQYIQAYYPDCLIEQNWAKMRSKRNRLNGFTSDKIEHLIFREFDHGMNRSISHAMKRIWRLPRLPRIKILWCFFFVSLARAGVWFNGLGSFGVFALRHPRVWQALTPYTRDKPDFVRKLSLIARRKKYNQPLVCKTNRKSCQKMWMCGKSCILWKWIKRTAKY